MTTRFPTITIFSPMRIIKKICFSLNLFMFQSQIFFFPLQFFFAIGSVGLKGLIEFFDIMTFQFSNCSVSFHVETSIIIFTDEIESGFP